PPSPIPVLWWRSVGHSHTAFVVESVVDELAHAAGIDPIAYRRTLLRSHPRHLGVLDSVLLQTWVRSPVQPAHGRGVAVHESFGSYVACAVEVSVAGDAIRVHRARVAIDCGTCVNPEGVKAQVQGGFAFGLSATLHSELTLERGRVKQ